MLVATPGKPIFFQADIDDEITIVTLSRKGGPNESAFRYAGEQLEVADVDVGEGKTRPGGTFVVLNGRRRLLDVGYFRGIRGYLGP